MKRYYTQSELIDFQEQYKDWLTDRVNEFLKMTAESYYEALAEGDTEYCKEIRRQAREFIEEVFMDV